MKIQNNAPKIQPQTQTQAPAPQAPAAKPQEQAPAAEAKKQDQFEVSKEKKLDLGTLSRSETTTSKKGETSVSKTQQSGLLGSSKAITIKQGDNSASVTTSKDRLGNQSIERSKTTKTGDTTNTQSTKHTNGQLRASSSKSETTEGNLTQATQIDKRFGRDGKLSTEKVTQTVTQKYGEHTTIARELTQQGAHSGEKLTSTHKASEKKTVTETRETKSGAQTDYSKWDKPETKFADGKFSSTASVSHTNKKETATSKTTEHDFRAGKRGTEAEQKAVADARQGRADKTKAAQGNLDVLAGLGVQTTLAESKKKETVHGEAALVKSADGKTFVGARATTTTEGKVTLGADGLKASGTADARAGLYAKTEGEKVGKYGKVSGSAEAKAEVYAAAEGSATLNLNGLEAKGKVGVGAEVSAEVKGSYTTPPVKLAGVDLTAGVEARGKVSAEAKAEASGRVQITGNPPTAVIEGEAGASAVVKAEGDVKAHLGPFAVKATGYVSAGAEAQAKGSIGYDNGKLKLSFGAGAALGVGAGGSVGIEVDVKQIKDVAVNTAKAAADRDGDGKLGFNDVKAGLSQAGGAISSGAGAVKDTVSGGLKKLGGWLGL